MIEMLIVIAVIAAILSVVASISINSIEQARATTVAGNLRAVESALSSMLYTDRETCSNVDVLYERGYINVPLESSDYLIDMSKEENGIIVNSTITFTDYVSKYRIQRILPELITSGDSVILSRSYPITW